MAETKPTKKNTIPEKYHDLFEKRAFGHLATIMPDGSPQVTPVWVDFDGIYVLVNSAKGRQKDLNIRRNNRVAIDIQYPDDPYRYVQVRGRVVSITGEGALDHIDKLARKYTGAERYQRLRPGDVRQIYKILPENF